MGCVTTQEREDMRRYIMAITLLLAACNLNEERALEREAAMKREAKMLEEMEEREVALEAAFKWAQKEVGDFQGKLEFAKAGGDEAAIKIAQAQLEAALTKLQKAERRAQRNSKERESLPADGFEL